MPDKREDIENPFNKQTSLDGGQHFDLLPEQVSNTYDMQAISIKAKKLLATFLNENRDINEILISAADPEEVCRRIKEMVWPMVESDEIALKFYRGELFGRTAFNRLSFSNLAAIRILDYIDHSGKKFKNLNLRGEMTENHPFKVLWLAARYGRGGAHPDFFIDMAELFRQLRGKLTQRKVESENLKEWMDRHPAGTDPEIVIIRERNKERIIGIVKRKIEEGTMGGGRFSFESGITDEEKTRLVKEWWGTKAFHLRFAVRDPELLNEMLDYSLSQETMSILRKGDESGIPIFVNPYYLSLLIINPPEHLIGADQPIRDYIFYSRELLDEFGRIVAWEKEDVVEPGKPNTAGWIIPYDRNLHRRYPDVAILIPDTVGRSCGGLCVSCQRMYDFQRGNLNFEMDSLRPEKSWWDRLEDLMEYFENDSQLCDILITGGDALMSSDRSLRQIFDSITRMAARKREANKKRPESEKYAEISRIRLGTRLPVYLPMRITEELVETLREFKEKASDQGIRQFVIQTHFETAMEVTPEAEQAVRKLLSAGWIVTNQQVFTASASRRGHTAKLRKVLNDIGVIPYYTFTVKGFMENYHNFATNARAIQEQFEEKSAGKIPEEMYEAIHNLHDRPEEIPLLLKEIREQAKIPFLATDRNMLNLPGVGKSLTFRTIGITRNGRRILSFDHDRTRSHSPIIEKIGRVIIIEAKPLAEYLKQLEDMGEDPEEYRGIFGYSIGFTEARAPVFKHPKRDYEITGQLTNFAVSETGQ